MNALPPPDPYGPPGTAVPPDDAVDAMQYATIPIIEKRARDDLAKRLLVAAVGGLTSESEQGFFAPDMARLYRGMADDMIRELRNPVPADEEESR